MAMLQVHSAIGQYPLANNDAIPRNTDVIRSIFQHVFLVYKYLDL